MPCTAALYSRLLTSICMRAWTRHGCGVPLPLCRPVREGAQAYSTSRPALRPSLTLCFAARAAEPVSAAQESSRGTQEQAHQATINKKTGAFQALPMVPNAEEHLAAALKRAARVTPSTKLKNEAAKARNKASRKMDEVVKAISAPLNACVKGFPTQEALHPFEKALLDLTIGLDAYQRRLSRVAAMRQACVEVGKGYAARTSKAGNKRDAEQLAEEGMETITLVYQKGATALDGLKDMAKQLRRLPTVDLELPTLALVGAPNVGKSSLVQILSSGVPEICDYPFTTRSIKMGHFYVDSERHQGCGFRVQVTDTPGLLNRAQEDRNAMERLTLACMAHLPSSVLFIMDLTGQCGTSVAAQWDIRQDLKEAFPAKPWLDVFTKADLLEELQQQVALKQAEIRQGAQQPHLDDSLAASAEETHMTRDGLSSRSSSEAPSLPHPVEMDGTDASGTGSAGSEIQPSDTIGSISDTQQQQHPSEAGGGLSGSRQGPRIRFKWGDRADNNTEKALEVAHALPKAIWVSSLTQSGLDDLKGSVLQLLAK